MVGAEGRGPYDPRAIVDKDVQMAALARTATWSSHPRALQGAGLDGGHGRRPGLGRRCHHGLLHAASPESTDPSLQWIACERPSE